MSAKANLIEVFNGMGYPYWLMHTMPKHQKYPASFFTFLSIDAPFVAHYDNRPHAVAWAFWVGFYSNNPALVESVPMELIKRLRAAGWVVEGAPVDVQSDEPTHTGRRITAYYLEPYKEV